MMSVLWLIVLLAVVPYLLGSLFANCITYPDRRPGTGLVLGLLMEFALFELVSIPFVLFLPKRFDLLTLIFGILLAVLSAIGLAMKVRTYLRKRKNAALQTEADREIKGKEKTDVLTVILWGVFALLLLFQLYQSVVLRSTDGDDAYYVGIANIANQTNNMYNINPYRGHSSEFQAGHALEPLPLYWAFLARVSGLHVLTVTHLVSPFLLLPATYYVYYLIGEKLFHDRRLHPVFMILISLLVIFGDVSIYVKENFLLFRTWQGKSIYANLILFLLFYALYGLGEQVFREEKSKKKEMRFFLLIAVVNIAGCLMTTLSALLSGLFIALAAVFFAIFKKRPDLLYKLALSCLPLVAELGLYLACRYYFR